MPQNQILKMLLKNVYFCVSLNEGSLVCLYSTSKDVPLKASVIGTSFQIDCSGKTHLEGRCLIYNYSKLVSAATPWFIVQYLHP